MKNALRTIWYRLRHGHWCTHDWGPWQLVDWAWIMARRCYRCGCVQKNMARRCYRCGCVQKNC